MTFCNSECNYFCITAGHLLVILPYVSFITDFLWFHLYSLKLQFFLHQRHFFHLISDQFDLNFSPIVVSLCATEAKNKSQVSSYQSRYSVDNFISSQSAITNSFFRSFSSEISALKFEGGISFSFPDPPFPPRGS